MNTPTRTAQTFSQRAAQTLTRYHHRPPLTGIVGYQDAANRYEFMKHEPHSFAVRHAYLHFEAETMMQYSVLLEAGLSIQWYALDNHEYPNSAAMFEDLDSGKLRVRLSERDGLPADHPMLVVVGELPYYGMPLRLNDVFRAVHDALGHGLSRGSFGPNGEEKAWLEHRTLYTEEALPALWCETRGQSAWTNYYGNHQYLPLKDRPFAEQKAGIAPSWML